MNGAAMMPAAPEPASWSRVAMERPCGTPRASVALSLGGAALGFVAWTPSVLTVRPLG
jgi:hypothetical protein